MRAYLMRRLLLLIPTLWIMTIVVFLSARFIPGDTIDAMMGESGGPGQLTTRADYLGLEHNREALERILGLDVPVHVAYVRWMGDIFLHGTLGDSLVTYFTVEEKILARLPLTIQLGVMAIVIGLVIALPVGIYSAIRQDTAADYAGRIAAIIGMATPNFWLAIMVMIYPALWWKWSPPMLWVPFTEDPLGSIKLLIIPSLILGTGMSAGIMRLTRTLMLEVLRQDYVRTAWSKGLNERVVIMRHALRNTLIPLVTAVGGMLPLLVGGSVIIENIFNLPGLGRLFLSALQDRDYPVISGANLVYATIVMLIILMIDISYAWLDPRVRYK